MQEGAKIATSKLFLIEPNVGISDEDIVYNPNDDFFKEFLKPYYIFTKDGQYLFGSSQPGRRPDRAFYMTPKDYKLGKKQKKFDTKLGKEIYRIVMDYIKNEDPKLIVQDGIQGERKYQTGLRIVISVENPHTAYIAWMGKLMTFPPKKDMDIDCWNYIIQEKLPGKYIKNIQRVWPEYDPSSPFSCLGEFLLDTS